MGLQSTVCRQPRGGPNLAPLRPDVLVHLIRVEQAAVEEAVRAEGQRRAAGADGSGRRKGAFDLGVGGRQGGSEGLQRGAVEVRAVGLAGDRLVFRRMGDLTTSRTGLQIAAPILPRLTPVSLGHSEAQS
jgi:hypothetical protein